MSQRLNECNYTSKLPTFLWRSMTFLARITQWLQQNYVILMILLLRLSSTRFSTLLPIKWAKSDAICIRTSIERLEQLWKHSESNEIGPMQFTDFWLSEVFHISSRNFLRTSYLNSVITLFDFSICSYLILGTPSKNANAIRKKVIKVQNLFQLGFGAAAIKLSGSAVSCACYPAKMRILYWLKKEAISLWCTAQENAVRLYG